VYESLIENYYFARLCIGAQKLIRSSVAEEPVRRTSPFETTDWPMHLRIQNMLDQSPVLNDESKHVERAETVENLPQQGLAQGSRDYLIDSLA
jgi:hypothetical protein